LCSFDVIGRIRANQVESLLEIELEPTDRGFSVNWKRLLSVSLLFLLTLLSPGCTGNADEKMKIGLLPIVDALPFFVAEEKGYFQAEGLDVEFIQFASALERDGAVQAGEIDGTLGYSGRGCFEQRRYTNTNRLPGTG